MAPVVGFWLALLLIYPIANGTAPAILEIIKASIDKAVKK
jgi:hypothetical protein